MPMGRDATLISISLPFHRLQHGRMALTAKGESFRVDLCRWTLIHCPSRRCQTRVSSDCCVRGWPCLLSKKTLWSHFYSVNATSGYKRKESGNMTFWIRNRYLQPLESDLGWFKDCPTYLKSLTYLILLVDKLVNPNVGDHGHVISK